MDIPIVSPSEFPTRGMRSSAFPSTLPDGMFQRLSNVRIDSGIPVVRNGSTTLVSAPATADAVTGVAGIWSGALNGTEYTVAVFKQASKMRVYVYDSTYGFLELSGVGGWYGEDSIGDSRFPTVTDYVSFEVVRTPEFNYAGSSIPGHDVLVIQNGIDNPRIYDPASQVATTSGTVFTTGPGAGSLIRITTLDMQFETGDTVVITGVLGTTEANGTWTVNRIGASTYDLQGSVYANAYVSGGTLRHPVMITHEAVSAPAYVRSQYGFGDYVQVAGATRAGASFNNSTGARFSLGNTTVAPYNVAASTDFCLLFTATTAAASGDTAEFVFDASSTLRGQYLYMLLEGADAVKLVTQCKIDLYDGSAYVPVYDPTSTTSPWLGQFFSVVQDSTNNRTMLVFSMKHIASSPRSYTRIRFTRTGVAPTTTQTGIILMIASTTGYQNVFPGGTSWASSFTNTFAFAESPGIIESESVGLPISRCGGPSRQTITGAQTESQRIPSSTACLYDWVIYVPNNGSNASFGDIAPYAVDADIYAMLPTASTYYYAASIRLRDFSDALSSGGSNGAGWACYVDPATTTVTSLSTSAASATPYTLDLAKPLPSAYNIPMPPAKTIKSASRRSFVGNVSDSGSRFRSDVYFSELGIPFRFQSVQTGSDSGSRLVFDGEEVQRIVASAAGAQGASTVYVLTSKGFHALGNSSQFMGSLLDSTALSVAVRVAPYGTYSPQSVQEYRGLVYWVNQDLHVMRFGNGSLDNLSRNRIEDKLNLVPASRISQICSAIRGDRYYLAYSPSGQTTNQNCLVWSEILQEWEADDSVPTTMYPEFMCVNRDTSLPGSRQQKLLFLTQGGAVFSYEQGGQAQDASTNISATLTSKSYTSTVPGSGFMFDFVEGMIDTGSSHSVQLDRFYTAPAGQYRTTVALPASGDINTNGGWFTDGNKTHTAVVSPGANFPEGGYEGYITATVTATAQTKVRRLISATIAQGTCEAVAV